MQDGPVNLAERVQGWPNQLVNPTLAEYPSHQPAAGVEGVTRRKGYASAGRYPSRTLPNRFQTTETQSRTLARAWLLSPLAAAGLGGSGHCGPSGLPATAVAARS